MNFCQDFDIPHEIVSTEALPQCFPDCGPLIVDAGTDVIYIQLLYLEKITYKGFTAHSEGQLLMLVCCRIRKKVHFWEHCWEQIM